MDIQSGVIRCGNARSHINGAMIDYWMKMRDPKLDENRDCSPCLMGDILILELYGNVWNYNYKEIHAHLPYFHMYIYISIHICSFCRYHIFRQFHVQVFIFDFTQITHMLKVLAKHLCRCA